MSTLWLSPEFILTGILGAITFFSFAWVVLLSIVVFLQWEFMDRSYRTSLRPDPLLSLTAARRIYPHGYDFCLCDNSRPSPRNVCLAPLCVALNWASNIPSQLPGLHGDFEPGSMPLGSSSFLWHMSASLRSLRITVVVSRVLSQPLKTETCAGSSFSTSSSLVGCSRSSVRSTFSYASYHTPSHALQLLSIPLHYV